SLLLFVACLVGCQSTKGPLKASFNSKPVCYSIIYLNHGEADYLYQNTAGRPLQADQQVLREAQKVARNATKGEVFIFHIRPEQKILWLFPRKDRQFYYYRHGQLVAKQHYSPHSLNQPFVTETLLYQKYHAIEPADTSARILLYFGHEIPSHSLRGYHHSRPSAVFNTQTFTQGIQSFLGADKQSSFDLTVLSTCNNGTPSFVQMLSPYTQYVLASPQDLHLSHLDTQALNLLDQPQPITTAVLADSLAAQSYRRLSSFLQTPISLSVYNTAQVKSYLPGFAKVYQHYQHNHPNVPQWVDNIDCALLPFYKQKPHSVGVQSCYKAPVFEVTTDRTIHSSWS